ncbi:MAG: DUF169 domain-containing protein [Lachnospiraceae bacterium]|nr:DUF169 domain-containing protein [Lachnospiraceae bacterium]
MESKIAKYIKLKNHPVAIVKSDTLPENALHFKEGTWNCVIAMLRAASNGKIAALSRKTVGCPGGKSGTGFQPFELGTIEYFLSIGGKGPKAGEFYKKTPELARKVINKDLLSFSIPFHRYLEMECNADESFLSKETWKQISERIE